jgi:hypothetical protein
LKGEWQVRAYLPLQLKESEGDMPQTAGSERRAQLKARYWEEDAAWTGSGNGWFRAPRTLPLILGLLSEKELTGGRDVTPVYLELLARHMDGGVVEIGNEADHAYGAGYTGNRAIRTWHERMRLLEALGLIKSKQVGNQKYRLVLLVDPLIAITQLHKKGKVAAEWWEAYTLRLMETKEAEAERLDGVMKAARINGNGKAKPNRAKKAAKDVEKAA